ncbi:MAG: NAD(P)-dependent oxidoreductase [Ruminococcus sp.]|nr:NAD(P)-dependent oxidoreductase [Ruminococcus sp.]
MANVFITGASGMMATAVIEKLLQKKHRVFGVDAKACYNFIDDQNFTFTQCEITDAGTITDIIDSNGIDTVIHLGCTVDNDLDAMVTDQELKRSKVVDKFLYAAADKAGVKNFILTSTTQVYGIQKGREPIRETTAEKGVGNYVDMKLLSEKLLLKAFKKSDSVPVIARVAPIYTADFTDNLRERVYDKKDDVAYIYREGEYGFSFCCLYNYVDFIMGIVNIPQGRYEGTYNICDSRQTTAKEILDFERDHHRIGAVIQRNAPAAVSFNKSRAKQDYRYFDPSSAFANWNIDNTKANRISTFRWNLGNTK